MNETLRVRDRILCGACYDQAAADGDSPETDLQRQVDPTVCVNCKKDAGATELPRLAGVPVCDTCQAFFRNRPFPAWIKLALAAVIVLVAVSLAWNMRFFQAYSALRRSSELFVQGQVVAASTLMTSAAGHVPECEDVRVLATYMEGVALLSQDKCAEALVKLKQCQGKLDANYDLELLTLQAQAGAAFDEKDYDGFLAAEEELDRKLPNTHLGKAGVASAWACKHAVSGDPACRDRAIEYLEQARRLAQGDPAFLEYENRIQYRLHTREIITYEEFHQRFPEGWDPQKED